MYTQKLNLNIKLQKHLPSHRSSPDPFWWSGRSPRKPIANLPTGPEQCDLELRRTPLSFLVYLGHGPTHLSIRIEYFKIGVTSKIAKSSPSWPFSLSWSRFKSITWQACQCDWTWNGRLSFSNRWIDTRKPFARAWKCQVIRLKT